MDWSNERYVRLYVRDTRTWLKLRWEGQCLFMLLIRKIDRAGILDDIEEPVEDLSLMTGFPEEHVKEGIKSLISLGVVQINNNQLIVPNFLEAQETSKTDAQRQREYREKRRDKARSQNKSNASQNSSEVSQDNAVESRNKTKPLQVVTTGHNRSQPVTPTSADPDPDPDPDPGLTSADPDPDLTSADPDPDLTSTDPDPDLTSTDPVQISTSKRDCCANFERFWKTYPRKSGKKAALKSFLHASKDGMPKIESILDAINQQKKSVQWQDPQLIPLPTTWLNQGRWDDELYEKKENNGYPTQKELDRMTPGERLYWRNRISLEEGMRDGGDDTEESDQEDCQTNFVDI